MQHLAIWQRILVVASAVLLGPIVLFPLLFVALAALPAIALAFPFFLASVSHVAAEEHYESVRNQRWRPSLAVKPA